MRTSAAYHGRRGSYRTGRHMGIAIRPRENLGGGVQGKVKRIPSATKGRRAHPHKVEKIIAEKINRKEYQSALSSAVSATASSAVPSQPNVHLPIIMTDEIESIKRAKEVIGMFKSINLFDYVNKGKGLHIRRGGSRSTRMRTYKRKLLIVVNGKSSILKAAGNIPGVDVCAVSGLTVNLLAPGGVPGRVTVWSESAVSNISKAIEIIKV
jgi:large subunit ribosomal protein L4e